MLDYFLLDSSGDSFITLAVIPQVLTPGQFYLTFMLTFVFIALAKGKQGGDN
jgi:hypothetical protein